MLRLLLISTLLLCASSQAFAQTRYVSDSLEVTLRSGPSTGHKIVRMLKSGTPVTILEEDSKSGYARVRSSNGAEGWVLTRYLMEEPAARDQLGKALETVKILKSGSSSAQTELVDLKSAHQTLEQEAKRLASENEKLQRELADIKNTAANALNLDSENKRLTTEFLSLERNFQLLQQQSDALKDRREQDWFIAGAGVLIAGMLMGLLLPKIRFRKKNSWGSL